MKHNHARPAVPSKEQAVEQGPIGETGNFTTQNNYKNITPECYCGTGRSLGADIIKSIYNKDWILEDNSALIFTPFTKDLTK